MKLNRFLLLAASTVEGSTVEQPSTSLEQVDFRPEDFNLPTDYTFASNSWGYIIFYKIYNEGLDYGDAKAQCESDGSFLAIPRSEAEEDFLFGLFPTESLLNPHTDDLSMWIGINDIEQEGLFVAVDGREISWTNWGPGEPNGGLNENAVEIRVGSNPIHWNDVTVKKLQKFVCAVNIYKYGKIFISELSSEFHLGITLHVKKYTNMFI